MVAAMGVWMLTGLVGVAGCGGAAERLNAPPQGQSDRPSELQDDYTRMGDNAMLKERSMSPLHFVPGTSELNCTGLRRLKRYVSLLIVYGGALHYDGIEEPKEVADARVDQIKTFLADAGVGPDFVSVDVGLAGGREMRAMEATSVRDGTTAVSNKSEAVSEEVMKADVLLTDGPGQQK